MIFVLFWLDIADLLFFFQLDVGRADAQLSVLGLLLGADLVFIDPHGLGLRGGLDVPAAEAQPGEAVDACFVERERVSELSLWKGIVS